MRQRFVLAMDRDLSRPHPDLLHERPHYLLPLGLVAADKAIAGNFAEPPNSRRCNSGRPTLDLLAQRLGSLV